MHRQLIPLALLLPLCAGAQDTTAVRSDPARRPPPRALEAELRVNGSYFDNFFQAPSGAPRQDMRAGTLELRLLRRLGAARRNARLDARAGVTAFEGLPLAGALALGARTVERRQSFESFVTANLRSPRFEVGDALEQANTVSISADYGVLLAGGVQLGAQGEAGRERYTSVRRNDNRVYDAGVSARYRGFGSVFSPEVGALWGRRAVENAAENYDQRTLFVQLRSLPRQDLYLSARFRHRLRDYETADTRASNFGREDARRQVTLGATLSPPLGPAWNLYYAFEDVTSTRAERSFRAHLLSLGATFRLGRF